MTLLDAKAISEDYVDQATAAKMLSVSRSRINKLANEGRFEGATKIGWSWLIPRVAVENFERLRPGPKPRGMDEKLLLQQALLEASNLKED